MRAWTPPPARPPYVPLPRPVQQLFGLTLLFMSLCFDGGTGAYEDKLMCKHHVGPFDLMFNIQFAKMLLAGLGLVITGQINGFFSVGSVG